MPQFLAEINNLNFTLSEEEARHIKVSRVAVGARIKVFDGRGNKYLGILERAAGGKILNQIPYTPAKREIHLYFSAIARSAVEDLLDKCTQVGVKAFHPVISARSEKDLLKKWEAKAARWRHILISACKQCETPLVPDIYSPVELSDALKTKIPAIICRESGASLPFADALKQKLPAKELAIFIGPEGGYTPEEFVLCGTGGITGATLGGNILRAETAAVAVCWAALQ